MASVGERWVAWTDERRVRVRLARQANNPPTPGQRRLRWALRVTFGATCLTWFANIPWHITSGLFGVYFILGAISGTIYHHRAREAAQ